MLRIYLRRLFDVGLGRGRNRIGHVVIVRLHRDDLRWRLGTRRLFLGNSRHCQNNATVDRIDFENPEVEVHRFVHDVRGAVHRLAEIELAHRNEAFNVVANVDNHALVHQAHDLAAQLGADRIGLTDAQPWILGRLLETKTDSLVLRVDVQDDDVDTVSLLHDFRRMLNAVGPGHVGDVNESVDAGLDFDERTKAREVPNLAVETRADRILLRQHHPRILLRLLHAERDLLFVRIDLEDYGFDCFTNRDQL